MLPDGVYDVFVVDAAEADGVIRLELTILAGEQKGEIVNLASPNLQGEPALLLGTPGTLTVADGVPNLQLEP